MTPRVRREELAAVGFANGDLYNRARPDYPADAISHLVLTLGLSPASNVVDLGAGTGIFSRQIQPFVGRLTAVEPSASMRESFRNSTSDAEVLEGTDVAIPVADASVDALFVAQAFHWFDAPRALVEIHRVLVPAGGLGIIVNKRDTSVGWVRDLDEAMRWDVEPPYLRGSDFTSVIAAGPFTDVRCASFAHFQVLTRDGMYERVLTTSYISIMESEPRDELMSRVATVVDALPEPIVLPHVTDVYTARASTEG